MSSELEASDIEAVTRYSREVSDRFLRTYEGGEGSYLSRFVIDSYNEFVSEDLPRILGSKSFRSRDELNSEFEVVVKELYFMPPFKGPINKKTFNSHDIRRRLKTYLNERDELVGNGDVDENFDASELDPSDMLSEQDAAITNIINENIEKFKPKNHWFLPEDARINHKPYNLEIYAKIVKRNIKTQVEIPDTETVILMLTIPLMVGSRWCWIKISEAPRSYWHFYGECQGDPLGHFLVGSERIFVSQEKQSQNVAKIVLDKDVDRVVAKLRSHTEDNRFSMTKVFIPKGLKGFKYYTMTKGDKIKPYINIIEVFRLYVLKAISVKGFNNLDIDSVKVAQNEFLKYVLAVTRSSGTKVTDNKGFILVVESAYPTLAHFKDKSGDTLEDRIKFLESNFVRPESSNNSEDASEEIDTYQILLNEVFEATNSSLLINIENAPNYSHELYSKSYPSATSDVDPFKKYRKKAWNPNKKLLMLAKLFVMIVKYDAGVTGLTDRNSFMSKYIAPVGAEMNIYVNQLLSFKLRQLKSLDPGDIESVGSEISSAIKSSFTSGEWGGTSNGKARTGVVQSVDNTSALIKIELLRRIGLPVMKRSNISEPREVHPTSPWVYDIPSTPDSALVGIVRHLSNGQYISTNYKLSHITFAQKIESMLKEKTIKRSKTFQHSVEVVLDNVPMGYCTEEQVQIFKDMKVPKVFYEEEDGRRGKITTQVGVPSVNQYCEVFVATETDDWQRNLTCHIKTSKGRPMRPVFVVDSSDIDDMRFIAQERGYFTELGREIRLNFEKLIQMGAVMFISPGEFEFGEFCPSYEKFLEEKALPRKIRRRIQGIEIDPSLIFSAAMSTQGYPQSSPGPRNTYGQNMIRQAQGLPFSTISTRSEKNNKALLHTQTPFVATASLRAMGLHKNPNGVHVQIAIKSSTGDDEDATIWKKQAFQNGLFNAIFFSTTTAKAGSGEDFQSVLGEDHPDIMSQGVVKTKFNPKDPSVQNFLNIPKAKMTIVNASNVVRRKSKDPTTNILMRQHATETSTTGFEGKIKTIRLKGNDPAFVQYTHTNDSGDMKEKVVVMRFPHIPGKADKFANPNAQKGVAGDIRDETDMPFIQDTGVVPDVIFSPNSLTSRKTINMLLGISSTNAAISCNKKFVVEKLVKQGQDFYIPSTTCYRKGEEDSDHFVTEEELRLDVMRKVFYDHLNFKDKGDEQKSSLARTMIEAIYKHERLWILRQGLKKTIERIAETESSMTMYLNVFGPNGDYGRKEYERIFKKTIKESGFEKVEAVVVGDHAFVPIGEKDESVAYSVLQNGQKAIKFSDLGDERNVWYQANYDRMIAPYRVMKAEKQKLSEEDLRDATGFRFKSNKDIEEVLESKGWDPQGVKNMVDPVSGESYAVKIFTGPCYYMALAQIADLKIQKMGVAVKNVNTRAPKKGGKRGGGAQFGEMSMTALFAHHNMSNTLTEIFRDSSDVTDLLVCACGGVCYRTVDTVECELCENPKPYRVKVPYSAIYLNRLMQAVGTKTMYDIVPHEEFPEGVVSTKDIDFEGQDVIDI